jgi:hypothetical protein
MTLIGGWAIAWPLASYAQQPKVVAMAALSGVAAVRALNL